MDIMVALDFPLQDGKQAEFLELLGGALPDTRALKGALRLRLLLKKMASLSS